jgi:hypothetical protein
MQLEYDDFMFCVSIRYIFHVPSQLYAGSTVISVMQLGDLLALVCLALMLKLLPALSLKFPRFELCFDSKNIVLHKL